jgi:hypothetical protein
VGWRGGDVTAGRVLPTRSVCGAIVSSQSMGDHEFWGIGVVLGLHVLGVLFLIGVGSKYSWRVADREWF